VTNELIGTARTSFNAFIRRPELSSGSGSSQRFGGSGNSRTFRAQVNVPPQLANAITANF